MQKHLLYYISLITILGLGCYLIYFFNYNKQIQLFLIILVTVFYAVWGILHSILHHSISTKIVLEYVAMAALGAAILNLIIRNI